ncbi:hypothetical protein [Kitasatospora sp. LaBMicrA B282]|uniref:hypothetical protein n=1 Tax=Kitasatospora sp. LaBMicrA B282 TaxID=3420949 RepID=UPI003D0AB9D1
MFFPLPTRPKAANLAGVEAALQAALDEADEMERPGLERALEILAGYLDINGKDAEDWARSVLELAGVDARATEVKAVRELRLARPDLTLKEAVTLARKVAGKAA